MSKAEERARNSLRQKLNTANNIRKMNSDYSGLYKTNKLREKLKKRVKF